MANDSTIESFAIRDFI